MKPRNKFETLIAGYSLLLQKAKPLTEAQKKWAVKVVHDKYFTTHYSNNVCLECTHKFKTTEQTKQEIRKHTYKNPVHVNCPKCGCKLNYTTRFYQYGLFTTYEVYNGHQVERIFAINKILDKGKEPRYFFSEVVQKWMNENGKIAIMSKKREPYYNDVFYYASDMTIQNYKSGSYYRKSLFEVYSVDVYPNANVLPILERNGLSPDLYKNENIFKAMHFHITDNFFESLIKMGQIPLAIDYMDRRDDKTKKYFNQIRICSKNQYVIENPSDYFDYLFLLEHFEKDLNSPKYLCPENFKQEHDYWVNRKAKQDAEIKFQDLQKEEKKYIRRKKRFFSFRIEQEDFVIKPAESLKEFIEAGDKLKHCIMINKYYEKPSLILMVEKSGKLIETAEVNPKQGKIIQCRGYKNDPTEHNATIVNIIQKNIPSLQKLAR